MLCDAVVEEGIGVCDAIEEEGMAVCDALAEEGTEEITPDDAAGKDNMKGGGSLGVRPLVKLMTQ